LAHAQAPETDPVMGAFRAEGQISPRDWLSMKGDLHRDVPGANVSVLWERELRQDSNLELHLKYDRMGEDATALETYDVDLAHRVSTSKRNQIAWGVGLDESVTSGFIRNDLSLVQNKVTLSVGTEIQQSESLALGIRPSGRLAWKPSGQQSMWAALSDTAYEVGYRVQPQPALSVSMATFSTEYGRTTNFESVPDGAPLEETRGTAITADFQATSRWKLSATQTEIHSAAESAPMPRRLISLRSLLDLPSKTQVDATWRRVSGVEGVESDVGYDALDVRLAWRPRSALELSFSGRNLLNDPHAQIAPFAAGLAGVPSEGRAAEANVAWSF
jgi:iron complex outermembrane receptor protein